jgi:hypothetical protein
MLPRQRESCTKFKQLLICSDYSYYSTREVGETYGSRYWSNGTVVGCLLDLDTNEMSFTYNGGIMPLLIFV